MRNEDARHAAFPAVGPTSHFAALSRFSNAIEKLKRRPIASGSIRSKRRVQVFKFDAGVVGCEVPLGDGVSFVSVADPGGDLIGDCLFVGDAPVETL
jgi:hypothetical protein